MSTTYIHPTAIVDEGASIGDGTRIWHFCHVMPHAKIGKNCTLGQNVFVANKVDVGEGVKIQNNVSLYEGVIVEDEVFIGPSAVFTNVINPRSSIERKNQFASTLVRKGVSIGANATIVCGIELGEYAFIAAGAVVTRDVLPFELIGGVAAKHMGWMSKAGHRLHFDEDGFARCPENNELYQLTEGQVALRD